MLVGVTAAAFIAGLGLGASLIIAIGAQNAFVLRRSLRREHAVLVALVCTLCDWGLIVLGALGFGALVGRVPSLMAWAAWGGAAFLFVHGALAFRSALHPGSLTAEDPEGRAPLGLAGAIVATLAVSLLNPHVYLDTVVLLGSVAAQYPGLSRVMFVLGAGVASAVWFFGIALGGRLLAPFFARESAWRVLDLVVGIVMWWIAAGLVLGQVRA